MIGVAGWPEMLRSHSGSQRIELCQSWCVSARGHMCRHAFWDLRAMDSEPTMGECRLCAAASVVATSIRLGLEFWHQYVTG